MTINSDTALKAPKMLIADDDPAIVQMLANRCLKMGFKVDTASNGMQLLIKARQWKPDVLIVDVNMPEMDGLSVCTKLLEPRGISVDVVVVTGYTDPETIERCESFGAFYARKGPDFWIRIRAALEELFPHMADKIEEVVVQATNDRVPEHPRVLVVDDDSSTEKNPGQQAAQIWRGYFVCTGRRAWMPACRQGEAKRHHRRQFHTRRRRKVPSASIAQRTGDRAGPCRRDESAAARCSGGTAPEA